MCSFFCFFFSHEQASFKGILWLLRQLQASLTITFLLDVFDLQSGKSLISFCLSPFSALHLLCQMALTLSVLRSFCMLVLLFTFLPTGLSRKMASGQKAKSQRREIKKRNEGNWNQRKKIQRKKCIPSSLAVLIAVGAPWQVEEKQMFWPAWAGCRGACWVLLGLSSRVQPGLLLASLHFQHALLIRDQSTQSAEGIWRENRAVFHPFPSAKLFLLRSSQHGLWDPTGFWELISALLQGAERRESPVSIPCAAQNGSVRHRTAEQSRHCSQRCANTERQHFGRGASPRDGRQCRIRGFQSQRLHEKRNAAAALKSV